EVHAEEGERLSAGTPVARLEVPDLASRLAQKQAELREAEARLRLLEAGPRDEEVTQQRQRVERARAWRDLARQDLARLRQALAEDLDRLEQQIAQYHAELDAAEDAHHRNRILLGKGAVTPQAYREAEKNYLVCHAQVAQAQAQKRARQAQGTLEA